MGVYKYLHNKHRVDNNLLKLDEYAATRGHMLKLKMYLRLELRWCFFTQQVVTT